MSSVYDRQLKGEGPYTSVVAGTSAAGAGATVNWSVPRLNHTMYVIGASGPTGGTVKIDVSADGSNWLTTTSSVSVTGAGVSTATYTGVASAVRANVTTGITGATGAAISAVFYGV